MPANRQGSCFRGWSYDDVGAGHARELSVLSKNRGHGPLLRVLGFVGELALPDPYRVLPGAGGCYGKGGMKRNKSIPSHMRDAKPFPETLPSDG